jgi:hypothetical protein
MTIIAAVFGFAGAKIFDNLRELGQVCAESVRQLFSPAGLTFYGG